MAVSSLIEEAKRVYAAAGLDCGNALLPPADEQGPSEEPTWVWPAPRSGIE